MNCRRISFELHASDVKQLFDRQHNARRLGLPFTAMITFAPFVGPRETPTPDRMTEAFRRFLKHVSVWVRRHTGKPFTYTWVIHATETGARPHLHVLLHLPRPEHREALSAALNAVYSAPGIVHVREASDEVFVTEYHTAKSGLGYMIRYMSQQAYRALGRRFNRAHEIIDGKHVGLKALVVGQRWSSSRNIIGKNQRCEQKKAAAA